MLTVELVEKALPANLKSAATQVFVDQINNIVSDPEVAEQVRNNFISYTAVLKEGRFKMEDYLNAVAFVSFKLMGKTNSESYAAAFPHRYSSMVAANKSQKDISAYVSAYAKGKLVNLIMEQCLVPTWVLNQDVFQQAINVQLDLMTDTNISPKVRSDAANSLLTHLKKPENQKFQISMDVKENSGMTELKEAMRRIAEQQSLLIASGVPTSKVAATPLIEGTATEVP